VAGPGSEDRTGAVAAAATAAAPDANAVVEAADSAPEGFRGAAHPSCEVRGKGSGLMRNARMWP
jgi:hypothetical protein